MDKPTCILLLQSFFITLLLFAANNCSSQTPVYKNYTVNDGLPSQVVYCALQDKQGYMWFGTDAGASRFDGRRFENFTTKNGLTDNEILNLFEDSKGRIWFLTLNGSLCYFYEDQIFNGQNDKQLWNIRVKSQVWSITEDSHHNLWIGTIRKELILLKNDGTSIIFNVESAPPSIASWIYIYEPNKEEIWILMYKRIVQFSNGRFTDIDPRKINASLSTFYIKLQNLTTNDAVYNSNDGLRILQNGESKLIVEREKIPHFDLIRGIRVEDGGIWLFTRNQSTFYLKRSLGGYEFDSAYLPDAYVSDCCTDIEGNKWFCTVDKGIFKILPNNNSIKVHNEFIQLKRDEIWSVGIDSKKDIWCGSSRGILYQVLNPSISEFNVNSVAVNCSRLIGINFDKNQNIWCTLNSGVTFLRRKQDGTYGQPVRIEIEEREKSMNENYGAKCLRFNQNLEVYIAVNRGIARLVEEKNKFFFRFLKIPNLATCRGYSLYFDFKNNMWFDNLNELYCFHGNNLDSFPDLDNEFLSQITEIEGTLDSTLIISTYGSGIKFFKNGKIINRLNSSDGLAGDLCRRIFVDSNTVYVATNQGYSYFTYRNNTISDLKTFSTSDGIVSNDIKDIYAKENKVYLATSSGLCIVDKKISQSKSLPPPLYITSLHSSDSLYKNWDALKLKHNTDFSINYIAITFEQPEKINYQYRLKNKSETWIETKNTTINFSSLSSGTYVFELRAKKYNSDWSQPVSMQFKILPPFWLEWWFLLIAGLLFISIIYYVVRFIASRKFRKQLELMKQQQMLSEERARISSDMHDDIGADLSNLLLLTRLTGRNSNLPVEEKVQLNRLELFTNGVIEKVDEIVWSLNPSNDSLKGLISFICDYFRNVVQLSTLKSFIEIPDDITDHSISAVFRRNVFLVVKESLNNIVNHSGATMITLVVMIDGDHLQVSIKDNGSGFKRNSGNQRGNGLSNMQRRIEEIDGQFRLESETKEGTSIFISIPLH